MALNPINSVTQLPNIPTPPLSSVELKSVVKASQINATAIASANSRIATLTGAAATQKANVAALQAGTGQAQRLASITKNLNPSNLKSMATAAATSKANILTSAIQRQTTLTANLNGQIKSLQSLQSRQQALTAQLAAAKQRGQSLISSAQSKIIGGIPSLPSVPTIPKL